MGRESDHIHTATLTTSTSVPVRTGVPCVLWLYHVCCGCQEVEPMGRESDHIHIATLTTSTSVPVRVEYVDRGATSAVTDDSHLRVNHHDFPDDSSPPKICLIYRPGHYDILYM